MRGGTGGLRDAVREWAESGQINPMVRVDLTIAIPSSRFARYLLRQEYNETWSWSQHWSATRS
jgi:hypothetical protein